MNRRSFRRTNAVASAAALTALSLFPFRLTPENAGDAGSGGSGAGGGNAGTGAAGAGTGAAGDGGKTGGKSGKQEPAAETITLTAAEFDGRVSDAVKRALSARDTADADRKKREDEERAAEEQRKKGEF